MKPSVTDIKNRFTINRKQGVNKVKLEAINFLNEFSMSTKETYGDISAIWIGEKIPVLNFPPELEPGASSDAKAIRKKTVDAIIDK